MEVLFPNVALNGIATQISNYDHGCGDPDYASYAIDGDFSTDVAGACHRCAVTLSNNGAWWQVDLLHLYIIEKVALTIRRLHGTYLISSTIVCLKTKVPVYNVTKADNHLSFVLQYTMF